MELNEHVLVTGGTVALMFTVLASFSPGYAQLDMASLTEEQKYTLDKIKSKLLDFVIESNFTVHVDTDSLAKSILVYFIDNGYTYCYKMSEIGNSGSFRCSNPNESTFLDGIVKDEYDKLVSWAK